MPNIIGSFDGEYAFLSNFYPSSIQYEGMNFPTVEHAFQAYKTQDKDIRTYIAISSTPGIAKRRGKEISLRPDWEEIKDEVMLFCLSQKFKKNASLKEKLLATGDAILIEGNTWGDTYWGVCNGVGKNTLGQLLMKVREDIQKGYI